MGVVTVRNSEGSLKDWLVSEVSRLKEGFVNFANIELISFYIDIAKERNTYK